MIINIFILKKTGKFYSHHISWFKRYQHLNKDI